MTLEDLHEIEDSFESYDDNKQTQAKKSAENAEEKKTFTGTTSARRRIIEPDNSIDDRWNKFAI
jgi:hypothetical protein